MSLWLGVSLDRVHHRHQSLLTPAGNSLLWVQIICPSRGAVFASHGNIHATVVLCSHTVQEIGKNICGHLFWGQNNPFLNFRYIVPLHYHILLQPNLTNLSFTGSVQIEINVQNNTNWVVLHSKSLQISKATILDQNLSLLSEQVTVDAELLSLQPVVVLTRLTFSPSRHCRFYQFFITHPMSRLAFFLPGFLAPGKSIFCTLSLTQNLRMGSMASIGAPTEPAQERAGESTIIHLPLTSVVTFTAQKYFLKTFRTLASTHFEPTSARMAFPCFDEPSFKANFSLRIRRSPEHISLSNMPVVSDVYTAVSDLLSV